MSTISADDVAVLHALADRRDAWVVVAVDVECPAHAREVVIGGRRDDAPTVGEAHRPEAGDEARVLRAVRRRAAPRWRRSRPRGTTPTASIIDSSTCWPPLPRARERNSAAVIACAAYSAVTLSAAVWRRNTGYAVVGIGLVRGEAGVRLDHGVVRAAVAVRADRAEPGERHVHDVRVDRARRRRSRGRACPSRRAGSSG